MYTVLIYLWNIFDGSILEILLSYKQLNFVLDEMKCSVRRHYFCYIISLFCLCFASFNENLNHL